MTPIEKTNFKAMQTDIQKIQEDMHFLTGKFDDLYIALLGSEISKDGGLVKRVLDAENELVELSEQLAAYEKTALKTSLYMQVIWGMGGVIITGIIGYIISKI